MKVVNQQQIYQNYHNNNLNSQSVRNNRAGVMHNTMASDTVSFNGLFTPNKMRKMDGWLKDALKFAPAKIDRSERTIKRELDGKSVMQKRLFAELAENYNRHNFGVAQDKKENADLIFAVVNKVKKPTKEHLRLVNSTQMNMSDISKCVDKLGDSSKKVEQFNNVYRDLINAPTDYNISKKSIIGILDSENSDKILKDYQTYRPYLRMHLSEKDCMKNLDEQIVNGTYDAKLQKNIYGIKKLVRGESMQEVIDAEKMAPFASPESNAILVRFADKLSPMHVEDKSNYKKNLIDIYTTTNKKNFEARAKYLDTYMRGYGVDRYKPDEMDNIATLFNKMDEDKSAKKFIEHISLEKTNTVGAGEYLKLIDNISPKRREAYADNITYIMTTGGQDAADKAVRFANINPGTAEGRVAKRFKNFVANIFKPENKEQAEIKSHRRALKGLYKTINIPESESLAAKQAAKATEKVETAAKSEMTQTLPAIRRDAINLPKMEELIGSKNKIKFVIPAPIEAAPKVDSNKLPAQVYSFPAINSLEKAVKATSVEVSKTEPAKEAKVLKHGIFANKVAKQPSAKKLAVISDVNNIIEKKLGKNTYADQSKVYANNATKMRAGMLPEIFASIKETRAQKRAAGTFNKHKSESNADALELFQKIKGNNKRLVNYMLKVRNEDGTRMYTVRDIIGKINETEAAIRTAKKSAPKDAPFMAKDAKALYNNVLEEQVSQHGALPRAKKA